MRNDTEILAILDNIDAATPPPPPEVPPEKRSLLYMPIPEYRRAFNLVLGGRLDKLEAMVRTLGDRTDVPCWVARKAIDAAIPIDHERELDDPENDGPTLRRAVQAMGFDPSAITWLSPVDALH